MDDARICVREEWGDDHAAVHAVNAAAFGRDSEAELVDRLRADVLPIVSLVAEGDARIVGHILFTPVTIGDDETTPMQAMALGPMAVLPPMQRQGIGSALVREGLTLCDAITVPAVFVLGHPEFYPRFDFKPAAQFGFRCKWNVPDEVFMVRCTHLRACAGGLVRYHNAFDSVE